MRAVRRFQRFQEETWIRRDGRADLESLRLMCSSYRLLKSPTPTHRMKQDALPRAARKIRAPENSQDDLSVAHQPESDGILATSQKAFCTVNGVECPKAVPWPLVTSMVNSLQHRTW
eukprot:m.98352 g.98352  ORF g.98352 m.98352 type:complete len:117 (+) comp51396_c0_seq4:171-521(+)